MAITNAWPVIHEERKALVADLESLSEARWATPSLSTPWTVRQVIAHMTSTAKVTAGTFVPGMITSGFKFEKFQEKGVAAEMGSSGADALARFKERMGATTHPPGPVDTMVGETIVHGEDIRRPLGIAHTYDAGALIGIADFYKRSNLIIGSKKRIAGLTLKATDADWTCGSGPEVSGPMLSLVMAMTGRKAVLEDLSGDGVAALRSRG